MLTVNVEANRVMFGDRFAVLFLRTLRVPDDGKTYPLPPGLGEFPVHRIEDYADRLPGDWLSRSGVFIPLYQCEALWLGFEAAYWKPNAIKIGVGNVNVITGAKWDEMLHDDPQDYLVCPPQPWLDGIKTQAGVVRQFVATSLGAGDTVESQLTGVDTGGIRLQVFEPRAGIFPDEPPPRKLPSVFKTESVAPGMGVAAGGQIRQKIYPDPHGLATWDVENHGCAWVHILNNRQYRDITGLEPPFTPVDPRAYTEHGFPWFEVYDETLGDLAAAEALASVKTLRERQAERGENTDTTNEPIEVASKQIKHVRALDSKNGNQNEE